MIFDDFPIKSSIFPWGCPFQSFTKRSPEPGPAPRPRDIAPEVRCSLKVAIWRCGDAEISIIICITCIYIYPDAPCMEYSPTFGLFLG